MWDIYRLWFIIVNCLNRAKIALIEVITIHTLSTACRTVYVTCKGKCSCGRDWSRVPPERTSDGIHIYVVSSVFFFLQKCNPLFFFLYPRENPIMK